MIFIQMLSCVKFPNSSHSCPVAADSVDQYYGKLWLFHVISSLPCRISSGQIGMPCCFQRLQATYCRKCSIPRPERVARMYADVTWVESLDAATNTVKWMQWLSAWWFLTWLSCSIIYGIIHDNPSH
jgi:hypothetical protein